MSRKQIGVILFAIGLLFCIVPPVLATLEYFPLFKEQPAKGVSALSVVFLFIAVVPLWKYIKRALKSPSAWMIWLVIWLFSLCFEPIVTQMKVIGFVSLAGSVVGAIFFRLARKYLPKKEKATESKI